MKIFYSFQMFFGKIACNPNKPTHKCSFPFKVEVFPARVYPIPNAIRGVIHAIKRHRVIGIFEKNSLTNGDYLASEWYPSITSV
ncbi:MAG: hypothetical protein D6748_06225 [Calditrichaeota bacterium]|nr:MAG: hypothetical protein D6748_06225 [Calditrichota bacterium]